MWKLIFILFLQLCINTLGSSSLCDPDKFLCFDRKQCVSKHRWCDGSGNDCEDRSDEKYCSGRNSDCGSDNGYPYTFKCDNGQCIPIEGKCDGFPSCSDGSDELECPCEKVLGETGLISFKVYRVAKRSFKCWRIIVPSSKYLILNITSFRFVTSDCDVAFLLVEEEESSSKPVKLCSNGHHLENRLEERFYTTVISYKGLPRHIYYSEGPAFDFFDVSFTIADLSCKRPDSIKCTQNSCVPPEKKCDGVLDCSNGADERGCEKGVFAAPGVNVTLDRGIRWLKEQRTAAWGWRDDTHRAMVAMYLAQGANFNGTDKEEDLMAKQLELQMMTAILRNETSPIPPNQLAMYVNALLVICHDPRNFYGFNLVKVLRDQMKISTNADHPMPYIALCNANEALSNVEVEKLSGILESTSKHPFLKVCYCHGVVLHVRKGHFSYLKTNINETTNRFKKEQNEDGSFGNIYTTALVIQALLSSGNEEVKDWDLKAAIEFLQRRQNKANGSFEDFLATTLILPILNAKSLSDIGNVNCTENLKMPRDGNPVSDIELRMGQKMSVKYCLYIGDEKDQMHPIALRTPTNITVLDVMRLAAEADPKYRFEYQNSNSELYIYKISGISNDPEDGKFWLLYTNSENKTLQITSKSPDKLVVHDKDNIVMWYRSAAIEQTS